MSDVLFNVKPERNLDQRQQLIDNLIMMNLIVGDKYFNMMSYAKFFCFQDSWFSIEIILSPIRCS